MIVGHEFSHCGHLKITVVDDCYSLTIKIRSYNLAQKMYYCQEEHFRLEDLCDCQKVEKIWSYNASYLLLPTFRCLVFCNALVVAWRKILRLTSLFIMIIFYKHSRLICNGCTACGLCQKSSLAVHTDAETTD